MKTIGIKTVIPPYEVTTAVDRKLSYSSEFLTFKIFKKGTISLTTDGSGNGKASIPHGLGFMPTFQVFKMGTASWQEALTGVDTNTYPGAFFPNPGNFHSFTADNHLVEAYTDAGFLHIEAISATINTTYTYKYYIFSDLSQFYSGSTIKPIMTHGLRVSKVGKPADTAKPFDFLFSSEQRCLQYYQQKAVQYELTLPAISGSFIDDSPEEATYVDIFHHMKYPPFFLAFCINPLDVTTKEIPDFSFGPGEYAAEKVSSFCDSERIRISWWRQAANFLGVTWTAGTLKLKVIIFEEDLRLD
jgi:hypothetical protein